MKGKLFLIGGAEKKDKNGILKNVADFTNGTLLLIPTALERDAVRAAKKYEKLFLEMGIASVEILDIRDKSDADNHENLRSLKNASTVFFGGGDQVRLDEVFGGTEFLSLMKERHFNDGLNYVGTSAGAAIAGTKTIYDGDGRGFEKCEVKVADGFGLINCIIDTHFEERNRLPRLIQYLSDKDSDKKVGIGIGEDTGVLVNNDECNPATVCGSGYVNIVDATHSCMSPYNTECGDKLSIYHVNISFLNNVVCHSQVMNKILQVNAG